jgi:ligand-binding sensor domain-containing protein/signal transduction histidine kinase/DNA-binding response OmpR family regulator
MSLNIFIILFLFLFLCVHYPLTALDPNRRITQYMLQTWDMQSGLPANSIFALQQTRDGYLWIGTQDGLVRFDGHHFELYNSKKIPQLKDNMIRALYEDRNGTLWIGTTSGGLTRYKQGEFYTYPITKYKALDRISAIDEDRWGNLWIGSFTRGLTCLSAGQFTAYTSNEGLPSNQVRCIYKDKNGDLWVCTVTGIIKVDKPGVFRHDVTQDLLSDYKTVCLYEEDKKELWIGTGDKGLFRLKNSTLTAYGTETGIPHLTIICLYRDSMKNLWIGTDGGGLTRMTSGKLSTLSVNDGLASGFVYSICEDREGSLWLGTLDGGLHQLRDSIFTTFTTAEGLAHNYVDCVYEDRAGRLWIGTKGGLSRLDLKTQTLTTVLTTRQGLLNNFIQCLCQDSSGHLRIGTWGGLHCFRDGKLTTLTKKQGLSDNRVLCLLEDRQGITWIGTANGLNRLDKNGTLTVFTRNEGLSSNRVQVIHEDRGGTLWIGTDSGLNRYDRGHITAYKTLPGSESYYIRCAYEDNRGTLWFGTENGLIRMKEKNSTWHIFIYTIQCGLIENVIYSILEDEKGYLWLGGQNGISRVSKQELEDISTGKIKRIRVKSFNEEDGMRSRWCTGIGCKTRDGRFWFPTSVGVTVIHPHQTGTDTPPPHLIIEKLIADGESVIIKSFLGGPGGRFYKKAPLAAGGILKLPPGKKRLELYYTAASFIKSRKINFKLKLEGYDRDWAAVGTARSTTYTGLSPGHYTFKVTACNPDGVWGSEGASISFYLRPYFYQTVWFYVFAVFFVLLAAFSFYRYRVRQLKAREKELGVLVKVRTRDLQERNLELEAAHHRLRQSSQLIEAKNLQLEEQAGKLKEMDKIKSRFFANISHEFRTPLTLIMGPLEQMLSGPLEKEREQKKKMRLMLRNSRRLHSLINQLLALSKFDSGTIKLQAFRQNIVPFLKGILHSFDSLAVQNEVELVFQTEVEDIPLYYDPEKLEEVVSNLLSNAVKFTPAGGRITLAVKVNKALQGTGEQDFLEISVSDTGPGIPPEDMARIFDRFYQADSTYEHHRQGTGIGLAIAREIVELHHGIITAHSPGVEGAGTRFVIQLPMGDAHLKPEEIVELLPEPKKLAVPHPGVKKAEKEEFEPVEKEEEIVKEPAAHEKDIILVVEDNADVREYIRSALEPGYIVKEAKDGEEGLRQAREIVPDLIICDIMMPGMDGYELCRTLKTEIATSHIPVILLTAKAAEENIIQGLETGADDYITKPFNTKMLLARIRNLIELRRHWQQTWTREMTLQPTGMTVSEVDKKFIKELKQVMEKNIPDTEFNVDQLCRKLYVSHATLYRKIHALTGETPTDFIRSYRLKRGAELLKSGVGTVLEVALEVGFSSANYFTKCFKKKFHQLPTEYQAIESE